MDMVNAMLDHSGLPVNLWECNSQVIVNEVGVCYNIENEPSNIEEAMRSRDATFWKEAIDDEMESIMFINTWILVDSPSGSKPIGCKWIFKKKMKYDGSIDKYKVRLVAKGFRQSKGIDYFDTYASVARISSIRTLISLASISNLEIDQMDVKTAFLNGYLDEELFEEKQVVLSVNVVRTLLLAVRTGCAKT
ncbi:uncharacterized mitochondrial protein AtMg00820-like [Corylus avellana]|uniref:uncharacterized mitochondrial protein AtMg00820-like n=1 Tax=Corylus avellana TaxID=13451 RepID=UPI00286CCAFC|nr:uncharacterized mitochondrial protein AtMg00820-like [Corylus avellana]